MSSDLNRGSQPPDSQKILTLAKWSTRFWAWLIDFIIVTIAFEIVFAIVFAPLAFLQGFNGSTPPWVAGVRYAVQSSMFFVYWIYFESRTGGGQSIGKRLLKIKTTDKAGNLADVGNVAIESFGKAFLLPIDVLLGWIFTNDLRQRLLSRAANTIVIRTEETADDSTTEKNNMRYVKEQ